MLAALIILFREVFEAGLIVGIVLAVTRGVNRRGWWISGSALAGVLGASLMAMFAGALSSAFAGTGQELFDATLLGGPGYAHLAQRLDGSARARVGSGASESLPDRRH